MIMELEGRIAIITGASSGIGYAIADTLRSTRSHTSSDRSGRTTTRSSRQGSAGTASTTRRTSSLAGLFDAAERFEAGRLPELIAGLDRVACSFPVQHLGANVPQAWASGAVVHKIATMLGPEPDAEGGALTLTPCLPHWLDSIDVAGLCVGDGSADFRITRDAEGLHHLDVTGGSGVDVKLDG